jgi:AraC-like DNA-binding protein
MLAVRPWLVMASPDAALRGLLASAAGDEFVPVEADGTEAAAPTARHAPPMSVVAVDGALLSHPAERASLRALLESCPHVALLLCLRDDAAEALGQARRLGAHEVLSLASEATPVAARARVQGAAAALVLRVTATFLGAARNARAFRILPAAMAAAASGGDARDLAAELGIERRLLQEWCTSAGLPAPRRLLGWTRLYLAASLLDQPWRSVEEVAALTGYSHPNALRKAFVDALGRPPGRLRSEGAVRATLEGYRSDARPFRSPARG